MYLVYTYALFQSLSKVSTAVVIRSRKENLLPHSFEPFTLSDEDKASAINLAFLLEMCAYDVYVINIVSKNLKEVEKRAIYNFWSTLTPVCVKAWLCMAEYEGLI